MTVDTGVSAQAGALITSPKALRAKRRREQEEEQAMDTAFDDAFDELLEEEDLPPTEADEQAAHDEAHVAALLAEGYTREEIDIAMADDDWRRPPDEGDGQYNIEMGQEAWEEEEKEQQQQQQWEPEQQYDDDQGGGGSGGLQWSSAFGEEGKQQATADGAKRYSKRSRSAATPRLR